MSRSRDRWRDLKSHRSCHRSSYWGQMGRAWSAHHSAHVGRVSRARAQPPHELPGLGWGLLVPSAKHVKKSIPTQMSGWAPLGKESLQVQEYSHLGWVSPCQELWSTRTVASKGEETFISWLAQVGQKKTSKPTRNHWGSDIGESNSPYFQRANRRGRNRDCHNQKGEGDHKTLKKAVSVLQSKRNPGCNKSSGKVPRNRREKYFLNHFH